MRRPTCSCRGSSRRSSARTSKRCRNSSSRRHERLRLMNINKYTEKAREVVATALDLAAQAHNPNVEPEHLLVALLEQREGIIPEVVRKLGRSEEHTSELQSHSFISYAVFCL